MIRAQKIDQKQKLTNGTIPLNLVEQTASLAKVQQLLASHHYEVAEKTICELVEENADNHAVRLILARCQLALQKNDAALKTYTHLFSQLQEEEFKFRAEAALVLEKKEALPFFRAAVQQEKQNPELYFLLATAEYKQGFILNCRQHVLDALRLGLAWDDEDPIDFVVQQVLPVREFHDFEQIYLDATELLAEDGDNPQNRWFSLNMPVYEIFSAKQPAQQKQRAADLALLLSPRFDDLFMSNGFEELRGIFEGLAKSAATAEIGFEACQALETNDLSQIARLILALELEHLKQCASSFGLMADLVDQTNLQQLVPLLPLRLAVALIFLYSSSNPDDKLPNFDNKLPENVLAGLLAACFISYYHQMEQYPSKQENDT